MNQPTRSTLIFGLVLAVAGCSLGGGGSDGGGSATNLVDLGGVTFDPNTSDDLASHPLGIPAEGSWTYAGVGDFTGASAWSTTSRAQLSGIDVVESTISIDTTIIATTRTAVLAVATDGAVYVLEDRDGTGAVLATYDPPALAFASTLSAGTGWIDRFGDPVFIQSTDATTPFGGFTGTIAIVTQTDTETFTTEYYLPGVGLVEIRFEDFGIGFDGGFTLASSTI